MRGQQLFQQATCSSCHDPNNLRHPFTDGVNHGSGADWLSRFVSTYQNDPRITGSIGTFSQTLLDGIASASTNDHEVNIYTKLDYFVPFCFDQLSCLEFDDPLAVRGQVTEETRRLNLIIQVNLEDPDRTFIPGNVVGINAINTPSLRGVWASANFLHHGLAHSIREAILGPGHPALHPGEQGWAADAVGLDSHGNTKSLSKDDVDALVRYVESIE